MSPSRGISKAALRDIIQRSLSETIEIHRASRESSDERYYRPIGEVTDDEINDFILTNPLYDSELALQLIDPGLLGFGYPSARVTDEALQKFEEETNEWVSTKEWIAADLVSYHSYVDTEEFSANTWRTDTESQPSWLIPTPTVLLLASDLLRSGGLLSDLTPRQFELLIGELLEKEGWNVEVTKQSSDGGIDVRASKQDVLLGKIKSIWQAKKYSPERKVGLAHVRELSGVLDSERATKAVLVTTSSLTKNALSWIRQGEYRLEAKNKQQVESWIKKFWA